MVALTTEQYENIIEIMKWGFKNGDKEFWGNNRIATALVIQANLGLRIGDILNLRLQDIIRDGDRYRLNSDKLDYHKILKLCDYDFLSKHYSEVLHKYENILNKDFDATAKNQKWVIDISYIHTGEGVLYFSIIRDLYDRSIVAYKTGTEQTVNLVTDTIKAAKKKEKVTTEVQLRSDQGVQYTSKGYFDLTKYGITPSMSRRGNCYDNALAEIFLAF